MLWFFVAWLYAALCTAAQADPISIAILGVGASATAVSVTTFLLTTVAGAAISFGLGALQKALSPKPKAGDALSGLETTVQIGGDIARQINCGIVAAKGQLVYHNTYGANNEGYQQIYVLSDWISDGLEGLFIDGKKVTLNLSASVGGVYHYNVSEHPGLMLLRFYNGTHTEADPTLISTAKPPGKYAATDKLIGLTHVVVEYYYAKDVPLFETGIPKLTFEMRGAKLYDPRRDSTVPGGSGAHRWTDLTTWEFTQNPAIMTYNFMRGFYRNGEKLMGMGIPAGRILYDTVFAAANVCDETVTLDEGGSESRYRAAIMLTADEGVTYGQTLEVLLSTFAGYLYDYSGYYYVQAGAGYTAAATITDAELVVGSTVTYAAKRSRAELVNRLHGQFLSAATDYQPASYTPQISASGVSADGEELGRSLDLMSVPSQFQAERIAQIRLRESRRQATASITLGFHRQNLQAGDWITWNSARFGNKTWRIQSRAVDPTTRRVLLELAEIDANVFSWSTADEGDRVPPNVNLSPAALATTVSAFAIAAVSLSDPAGNLIPGLKFTWVPVTDPTIDAVIIEYRKVGTTTPSKAVDYSPQDGIMQVTDGVVGGTAYEARATISTTPPRVTTWTGWVSTTTSALFFNIETAVDAATTIPTGLVLTTGIDKLEGGAVTAWVRANWNDVTSTNLSHYEVEAKEGTGSFIGFSTNTSEYYWRGFTPGTLVTVRVRGITKLGTQSGFSVEASIVAALNTTPPSPITGLSATATFRGYTLRWTNPPELDYHHAEIWEATTNNRASATQIANVVGSNIFFRSELAPGDVRFVWVRPVNSSGYAGVFTPLSATAGLQVTILSIISADIAAQAIDQTKFANNMQPVGVIASTAAPHVSGIDTALNTADGKLYRWNGSAWTAAVPATDVTGALTSAQIADLDAAKLTGTINIARVPAIPSTLVSGQMTSAQIASLDAAKLTGSVPLAQIPVIPSSQVSGTFSDAQLSSIAAAKVTGTIVSTQIADDSITTAKIAAGTITAGDIAANTITSSQIAANTITSAQIAAGTITGDRIQANTLTANEIAANAITASELAANAVTAGKIAAGTIVAGDIAANTITSGQIAANTITAAQIAGDTITANQIAANAITASELAADSVTANKIAAGQVIAGKLAADAVVAGNIAALAVTAGTLAAGAVTAGKIAAGAIVAADIAANTITAAQIAAGAINATQIAAKAITADKLAIGTKNVAFNTDFNIGVGGFGGWAVESGSAGGFTGGTNGPAGYKVGQITFTSSGYFSSRPMLSDGTLLTGYAVTGGNYYEASICLAVSASSAQIQINWFNSGGGQISTSPGNAVSSNSNGGAWQDFPKSGIIAQAPSGAAFARVYVIVNGAMVCQFSGLVFQGAYSTQTALSPYTTPGITIIGGGNITTNSIVTEHMSANTINGDRITGNTLNANKILAGSILTASVTVGVGGSGGDPGGDPLGTVVARAFDPAARINSFTSLIGPGKILISGSTVLSSWQQGTDATKIAGGAISANTIDANKIKIGVRGVEIIGLQFQAERNSSNALTGGVLFSAGTITWNEDNGSPASVSIGASGFVMFPGYVIYWTKGENVLRLASSPASVLGGGADNIILMTYLGGGSLNVNYGGTIIDGTQISTGTVHANRIEAGTITATQVLQSQALIVNTAMIQDATIGTLKVLDGSMSDVYAASGNIVNGDAIQVGPLTNSFAAGRRFTVSGGIQDNVTPVRTSAAGFNAQLRFFIIQVFINGTWTNIEVFLNWDTIIQFLSGIYYLRTPGGSVVYSYESPGSDDNLYFRILNQSGISFYAWITVLESKR